MLQGKTKMKTNLQLRNEYYNSYEFQRNAITILKSRYLAFWKSVPWNKDGVMNRYNRAYHSNEWKKISKQFHFEEINDLLLYYSLAVIKNSFPVLPWRGTRRKQMKIKLDKELDNYVIGFDWAIELDTGINNSFGENRDFDAVLEDTRELAKMFVEKNIVVYIKFSGNRGFHFRIPHEYIKDVPIQKIQTSAKNFVNFYVDLNIDTFSNDPKKLWKLDYSVVNDKIALPLTKEQLEHFTFSMVSLQNWRSMYLIKRNGEPRLTPFLNGEPTNEQIQNTKKFIEEWSEELE